MPERGRSNAHLTVIGAGPVGSLLALMLARRGFDVDVYERRADMRHTGMSAGRSINLAVSTRGLFALHQVGLDAQVLQQAVPMLGRRVHSPAGERTFLRYGKDDSEFINSMSRGELNKLLMTEAEEAQGKISSGGPKGRVRIHFEQRLVHYDCGLGEAHLRDERSGEVHAVAAPVLIGSDGSASALRLALVGQRGVRARSEVLDSGYKELTLPSASGTGQGEGRFALEPDALHLWPRGNFMLIALPNRDGSFTCTLFLPFHAPAGGAAARGSGSAAARGSGSAPARSSGSAAARGGGSGGAGVGADEAACFDALVDEPSVRRFFARHFADVVPLIPDLSAQFLAAPLGQMVTVKAEPWASGGALLIGDAAHAIVPFFGQGMNAGFEDCTLLDALLERSAQSLVERSADPALERSVHPLADWEALFAEFAAARKPDADAIADLAVENYVEMRDKVGDPRFLLQKAVEAELQRRLPGRYLSRYQLVTFSRVRYRVALEAGLIQAAILTQLCKGKTRPEQIDYQRGVALVEERLLPFLLSRPSPAAPSAPPTDRERS